MPRRSTTRVEGVWLLSDLGDLLGIHRTEAAALAARARRIESRAADLARYETELPIVSEADPELRHLRRAVAGEDLQVVFVAFAEP